MALLPITPEIQRFLEAGDGLAATLRVLKKYAAQEREKGLLVCQIDVRTLFEEVDNTRLAAWDDLKGRYTGQELLLEDA